MVKQPTQVTSKPLKRRAKQARSKATVEAIVEAAAQILSGQGLAGLNTNAIAKRAGVSVGSVYEYFADKRAIVDLLLDRHLGDGEAALRSGAAILGSDPKPADIVDALVAGSIQLHQADPQLHRVLSSEVVLSESQAQRVADLRAGLTAGIAAMLANSVEDPQLKATILVDTADALAHRWIVDDAGTPVAAERLAGEMRVMLGAYLNAA